MHIDSNAAFLDGENAGKLLDSGLDSATLSVDGAIRQTYEETRKGLRDDLVRDNVGGFFRLKSERRSPIRVTVQMVVSGENEHEIGEYSRRWSRKADRVLFKAMHNFLDMGTSVRTKALVQRRLRFCKQPFNRMFIYWNADVPLCCWDYDDFGRLGSVGEASLLSVFNNRKFQAIRAGCREWTART